MTEIRKFVHDGQVGRGVLGRHRILVAMRESARQASVWHGGNPDNIEGAWSEAEVAFRIMADELNKDLRRGHD